MALATVVGGAFLSAFLQVAFDRLASKGVTEYFKREKLDLNLLEKLKITMLSIDNVINDAEDKEITKPSVKQWLDALKDAIYNAEDVLDVISTLDHTYKMETTFNPLTSNLRSSWNPFDVPIHQELHDVFGKLQFLLEQKDVLGLKESNPSSSRLETPMRLPTTSIVEESAVYGRDVDKDRIAELLLSNDQSNVSVIAIVRMGGLGKTTLAQLLFNDEKINRFFELHKVWICVAEDFDVMKITKTILEKLTSQSCDAYDFDQLQMKLKETLSGKRFLITLDDVWNENYMNWDNLRRPFGSTAPGSKIVVTTRSERVVLVMRATSTYKLKPLSDEACWLLFANHAFENIESSAYSTFEVLGRELVKKCRGLPLAAKVLGSLLRTKLGCEEWDEILTSDIWDLSDETSDNILPVLRLSYHYLPSNLKRCFTFCSILPRDLEFEREKIVLLWMAENLLLDFKSKKRMDVGFKYLRDLESRSLIQPSTYYTNERSHFTMHDLVNDLAKSVAGEFGTSYDVGTPFIIGEKARYFSYVMSIDDNDLARVKGINEAGRLRAFMSIQQNHKMYLKLPSEIAYDLLQRLNFLRTLILPGGDRQQLPDSIENLKLLRYLDLSNNKQLIDLPESVASLYNLEVLILEGCNSLTKLPSKMRQLTKLNYLTIRGTTSLQEMPLQIGRLTNMDVLTDFVVGKGSGSSITELKELKDLRGDLSIRGLQNIAHPEDALEANMKEKSYLTELRLKWDIDADNSEDARNILENLKPHVNLKKLYISAYSGTRLPNWSGGSSFINLVNIEVFGFKHCFHLSPLGQLPSLKSLSIYECDSLVTLVELPNDFQHVGYFCALVKLHIFRCASLKFFPLSLFPKLKNLRLNSSSIDSLAVIDEANNINLEYLEAIDIWNCPNFEYFNVVNWCAPKMTSLWLDNCESLKVLPENMCDIFPSLKSLSIHHCRNLEALPQIGLPVNLSTLRIEGCKKLIRNGLQRMLSLSALEISDFECDDLEYFPDEGLLPLSLSTLRIEDVRNLRNLNGKSFQLLTSLDTLSLYNCPKLQCLPELPTSLSSLYISSCRLLESRCQREQGEDWSNIVHIPNIQIIHCEYEYDSNSE